MKNNTSGQDFSVSPANICAPSFDARPPANGSRAHKHLIGANAVSGILRPQSGLMTRREAAAYLGVNGQTLAVWKSSGRYSLPCVKIGSLVKYRQCDLDAFIAKNLHGLPDSLN